MNFGQTQRQIFQFRSNLVELVCPKCRKRIMGRAIDMENFLKVRTICISPCRAECAPLKAIISFSQATIENKSGDDKSSLETNESRDIKSLEEEKNHLNDLKLQLKMVKAKSTLEAALEQVSKKE